MPLDKAHKYTHRQTDIFKNIRFKRIVPCVKCNFFFSKETVIYPTWCRVVGDGMEGTRLHKRYSECSQRTVV